VTLSLHINADSVRVRHATILFQRSAAVVRHIDHLAADILAVPRRQLRTAAARHRPALGKLARRDLFDSLLDRRRGKRPIRLLRIELPRMAEQPRAGLISSCDLPLAYCIREPASREGPLARQQKRCDFASAPLRRKFNAGRENEMFNSRKLTIALLAFGIAGLVVGTALHPGHENPADAVRAFAEYAADRTWLASHLIQLAGVIAMLLGMLSVVAQLGPERGAAAALPLQITLVAASASLYAALQAVDGVALKLMLDQWAASGSRDRDGLFIASLAIRHVEIGLAAIVSLATGLTVLALNYPLWSAKIGGGLAGALGLAGGLGLLAGGIAMGAGGFSGLAMSINMPSRLALLAWVGTHAVIYWRSGRGG
jgi:hypothetical protein